MATYLIIDTLNLFMRVKNVVRRGSIDMRLSYCFTIMFQSLAKANRKFGSDHVIFCMEGRNNWRKQAYAPYKKNRVATKAKRTQTEVEDDEIFFEAFGEFIEFLKTKTNVTVVGCDDSEADDVIATWIDMHQDDLNIIVSTDSDFVQLLAMDHCEIYNGMSDIHFTKEGAYNDKNQNMKFAVESSGKVKVGEADPDFKIDSDWTEFQLFLKCIRGDTSDNIFTAMPGARLKGSKNKTGISEAFSDRNTQGFNYNNFMLQEWVDHNNETVKVRDAYLRNASLINLTKQPPEIKEACRTSIYDAINNSAGVSQVGIHFMRFCGQWGLIRLSENPTEIASLLNMPFTGDLNVEISR